MCIVGYFFGRMTHVSDTWKCGSLSFIFTHLPEDLKKKNKETIRRRPHTEAGSRRDDPTKTQTRSRPRHRSSLTWSEDRHKILNTSHDTYTDVPGVYTRVYITHTATSENQSKLQAEHSGSPTYWACGAGLPPPRFLNIKHKCVS